MLNLGVTQKMIISSGTSHDQRSHLGSLFLQTKPAFPQVIPVILLAYATQSATPIILDPWPGHQTKRRD